MHYQNILILSALATVNADHQPGHFNSWSTKYGRNYKSSIERTHREQIFLNNLRVIEAHNLESNTLGWKMAMNEFMDVHPDEFKAHYLGGYIPDNNNDDQDTLPSSSYSSSSRCVSNRSPPSLLRRIQTNNNDNNYPTSLPTVSSSWSFFNSVQNIWPWSIPRSVSEISPSPSSSVTPPSVPTTSATVSPSPSSAPRPTSVDWSNSSLHAVTSIRAQGSCGACFAFATVAALETAIFIQTGTLPPPLSEQQILDQSGGTCNGYGVRATWNYIKESQGLYPREVYPYTGIKSNVLPSSIENSKKYGGALTGFRTVQRQSQQALEYAIALQPTVVPIQADESNFMFYSEGIMNSGCGTTLNHAVVAVGYGTDTVTGHDYYKIRNSWGDKWGEQGYIRIARGERYNPLGLCGVQTDPTLPVLNSP